MARVSICDVCRNDLPDKKGRYRLALYRGWKVRPVFEKETCSQRCAAKALTVKVEDKVEREENNGFRSTAD